MTPVFVQSKLNGMGLFMPPYGPAVRRMLEMAIQACRSEGKYVGICGQGPSDHPDLARWLVEQGISSVSLNPDTVIDTWVYMAS